MLYAILCYHDEAVVGGWSKDEDDAVMARLAVVHGKLAQQGRLVVEAENLDGALEIAQDLGRANPGGAYEIRPIGVFHGAFQP
jgi:hypothetical protein